MSKNIIRVWFIEWNVRVMMKNIKVRQILFIVWIEVVDLVCLWFCFLYSVEIVEYFCKIFGMIIFCKLEVILFIDILLLVMLVLILIFCLLLMWLMVIMLCCIFRLVIFCRGKECLLVKCICILVRFFSELWFLFLQWSYIFILFWLCCNCWVLVLKNFWCIWFIIFCILRFRQ